MRIAYEHADSFVTYPQAPNLSAKAEPIRKRLTYPRAAGPSAAATHTRSCAAGPYWWQCGRPAWTTTCGVNLRMKDPGIHLSGNVRVGPLTGSGNPSMRSWAR